MAHNLFRFVFLMAHSFYNIFKGVTTPPKMKNHCIIVPLPSRPHRIAAPRRRLHLPTPRKVRLRPHAARVLRKTSTSQDFLTSPASCSSAASSTPAPQTPTPTPGYGFPRRRFEVQLPGLPPRPVPSSSAPLPLPVFSLEPDMRATKQQPRRNMKKTTKKTQPTPNCVTAFPTRRTRGPRPESGKDARAATRSRLPSFSLYVSFLLRFSLPWSISRNVEAAAINKIRVYICT